MKTFSKYVKAALVWANGMGYEGDKKKQAMLDFVNACFIGGLSN